jgi:hypothetical protein
VWGGVGDLPVPADYDGDGITDFAVFRPATSEWLIRRSSDDVAVVQAWGSRFLDDVPVLGDLDADGTTDIVVYRRSTGEWFIRQSATNTPRQVAWGSPFLADVPLTLPLWLLLFP